MSTVEDFSVTEVEGDLFDAPDGSALIHACNVQGNWGAGIAKVFQQKYPNAYRHYHEYCEQARIDKRTHQITNLQAGDNITTSVQLPLGSALIIPPQPGDAADGHKSYWVICLFTSRGFGRRVDSPDQIVNSTYAALKDLKAQLESLRQRHGDFGGPMPGKLFSCRFNSGLFAVPWERTRQLLEDVGLEVTVVYSSNSGRRQSTVS